MGWTSADNWTSKKAAVAEILSENKAYCLDSKLVGNELWTVLNCNGRVIIVLYLLEKTGKTWAYKDMDEAMGPYYYKCPPKFLSMAPETCPRWREAVKAAHAGVSVLDDSLDLHEGEAKLIVEVFDEGVIVCAELYRRW